MTIISKEKTWPTLRLLSLLAVVVVFSIQAHRAQAAWTDDTKRCEAAPNPCPVQVSILSPASLEHVGTQATFSYSATSPEGIDRVYVYFGTGYDHYKVFSSDEPTGSFTWDFSRSPSGEYHVEVRAVALDKVEQVFTRYFYVGGDFPKPAQPDFSILRPSDGAGVSGDFTVEAVINSVADLAEVRLSTAAGDFIPTSLVRESDTTIRAKWDITTELWPFNVKDDNTTLYIRDVFHQYLWKGLKLLIKSPIATGSWLSNTVVTYNNAVAQKYAGRILIQRERNGEAWYINPSNLRRYYLANAKEVGRIIKTVGLGIKNIDLNKIPVASSSATGDIKFRNRMAGRILIQVENHGRAWYVNPTDKKRYELKKSDQAFILLRKLGVGATNATLAAITPEYPIISGRTSVKTSRGTFTVTYIKVDTRSPGIRFATDTASDTSCSNNCPTLSVGQFAQRRGAIAAINGTYFCPDDYASCSTKKNYVRYAVFNSFRRSYTNSVYFSAAFEPYIAFDTTNKFFMDVQSGSRYESLLRSRMRAALQPLGGSGVLQAAMVHGPGLVSGGSTIVSRYQLDSKQARAHAGRNGIGKAGNYVYLFTVSGATIPDSAAVAKAMGMTDAVALDGGGSTALYFNGKYVAGPGRTVPNAILVLPR